MRCTTETDSTVYVSAFRGDSVELTVQFFDAAGQPLDVSGWSWLAQVRDDADALIATFDLYEADDTSTVLLSLSDEVTVGMVVADFDWDLQGTDDGGSTKTLVTGRLRLKEDVSTP